MRKLQENRAENLKRLVKHGARLRAETEVRDEVEGDVGKTLSQSYDWLRKSYMLKEKVYHWAIKVKLDILPCRGNLHQWGLSPNKMCLQCRHNNETTHHVLNACSGRLNYKLYTRRHNAIQDLIGEEVKLRKSRTHGKDCDPNEILLCDKVPLPEYSATNMRPDLQLLKFIDNPNKKSNFMVDIKCPEVLTVDYRGTHRRNVRKYGVLVNNAIGWNSRIETFIVSSNGVVPNCSLKALMSLELSRREAQRVIAKASFLAINQSYKLLSNTLYS